MQNRLLTIASVAALAGACSSAPAQDREYGPSEAFVTAESGSVQASEASAPTGAWNQARGELLRTFAFRALERDLLEEGRQYLTQACEADPNDAQSHAALARLYLAEGDPQAALVYAQRASVAAPENAEVCLVYAAALAETNQPGKATEQLDQAWIAVATDPEFARSILMHYAALGETERAQDFITKRMTEDPEHAGTWAAAGDLMLAQGDIEGAAASYQHALTIDPTVSTPVNLDDYVGRASRNEEPVLAAARAAESNSSWQEAANLYQFLVGKDNVPPESRLGLARCLLALERPQEAEVQLGLVPHGVRGWRGHLLQARVDVAAQRWGPARTACLLALQERPGLRSAELLLEFAAAQQAAAENE